MDWEGTEVSEKDILQVIHLFFDLLALEIQVKYTILEKSIQIKNLTVK